MAVPAKALSAWKDGDPVTVRDLAAVWRPESGVVLLDVREPWEVEEARIIGAVHIPLVQLEQRCYELPKDQPVVAHCHHGMRSARAVALLQDLGYKRVHNLLGGIDAWSQEIDADVPRY